MEAAAPWVATASGTVYCFGDALSNGELTGALDAPLVGFST